MRFVGGPAGPKICVGGPQLILSTGPTETMNQSCKPGQALSRKVSLFQGLGPYLKERVPLGTSLTFWVPIF